jgi:hypothetical protein
MSLFNCLKWPEMREVACDLINRIHEGHARRRFSIPVVDFVGVFAPHARREELAQIAMRGDLQFIAEHETGGIFTLAAGERALLDLGREGLVMRLPVRMSGRYEIRPEAFRVEFNKGEELEGCKRLLLLVCNRVIAVDVSKARVDVHMPSKLFDLCVEFD